MGDWERAFGEAGMQDGFIDAAIKQWGRRDVGGHRKITFLFQDAKEAMAWAKEHPGSPIVRHPTSEGFIARTWEWEDDDGVLWGTIKYIRASHKECNEREHAVKYATVCMCRKDDVAALWLYFNGHRQLLRDRCEDLGSSLWNVKIYGKFPNAKDLKYREELEALLPPDIDTIDLYNIPNRGCGRYEINIVKGWIGAAE